MPKKILQSIRKEVDALDTSIWSLAKFGFTVGGILLLLAGFAYWRHKTQTGLILGTPGFLLFALGALQPKILRYPYRWWMTLAVVLGLFMSKIVLSVLFYLFVTPIGLLMMLFKGNPLEHKTKDGSFWIPRISPWTKESMEKLF